jgi:hypothetical protein
VGVHTLWSPWFARHTTDCHSQGQFYFSADIQQTGAATGTNRLAAIAFIGCLNEDKNTIRIALKFAGLYVHFGRRRFFTMRGSAYIWTDNEKTNGEEINKITEQRASPFVCRLFSTQTREDTN